MKEMGGFRSVRSRNASLSLFYKIAKRRSKGLSHPISCQQYFVFLVLAFFSSQVFGIEVRDIGPYDTALTTREVCRAANGGAFCNNKSRPYNGYCGGDNVVRWQRKAGWNGETFTRIDVYWTCHDNCLKTQNSVPNNQGLCIPHGEKPYGPPEVCANTNPINIAIGNKYQQQEEYRGAGAFPLSVARAYNSYSESWRFLPSIEAQSVGHSVILYRSSGKGLSYWEEDGSWVADPDVTGTLVASEDTYGEITGWTYTTSNDQVETYDAEGRILSVTDRSGLSHTYSYQSDSITVTHTSGDTIVYQLDTEGRVIGFTDPDNNAYQYSYDSEERIVIVTYPDDTPLDSTDNPKRIYHYEDPNFPHALTGITDENGNRYATWSYDEEGRAISSEHANGIDKVTLAYNVEDGTTTATNPLGKQTTYHFTTIHGIRKVTQVEGHPTASCEGANKAYSYDANGNIASKTDWNGVVTNYTYDMDRNLELTRTEAAGTPQERTITTEWHPQFRLPTKITEPNRITEYTYDGQGRQLTSKVSSNQ